MHATNTPVSIITQWLFSGAKPSKNYTELITNIDPMTAFQTCACSTVVSRVRNWEIAHMWLKHGLWEVIDKQVSVYVGVAGRWKDVFTAETSLLRKALVHLFMWSPCRLHHRMLVQRVRTPFFWCHHYWLTESGSPWSWLWRAHSVILKLRFSYFSWCV